VEGLSPGRHTVAAKKEGFKPFSKSVSNPDKQETVELTVAMVKEPTKAPPVEKAPVAEARPAVEKPEKKPAAERPGAKKGKFACSTKPTGADVWIDGKNTGEKTNIAISRALELPVGKHKVVFKLNGKATTPMEIVVIENEVTKLVGIEVPQ
jgi:hypothetical protein